MKFDGLLLYGLSGMFKKPCSMDFNVYRPIFNLLFFRAVFEIVVFVLGISLGLTVKFCGLGLVIG